MKVAFCTHVSDDWYIPGGARNLERSFRYFHPDIEFITFKSKDLDPMFKAGWNWVTMNAAITATIAKNYELIIHMDADSLVVSKLDEVLEANYWTAGVRNNNDLGLAGAMGSAVGLGKKGGVNQGVAPKDYWNAGFIASTDPSFWDLWKERNKREAEQYPFYEQDILNLIVKEHRASKVCRTLDPIEGKLYYGLSSHFQTQEDKSHWGSWKKINMDGQRLMLNGKQIKVLHQAGGSGLPKMDIDRFFVGDVNRFLKEITR